MPSLIENVSDTARWVAAYRAEETARPDALFHDHLAARLAGEKGRAIAQHAAPRLHSGWPLVVRTKVIDDLVLDAVADGADLVVNLAAGLDTRPYRLKLPPSLRWVEADLPAIMAEKDAALAGEKPRCVFSRVRVDLADVAARRQFLDATLVGARRALVITEGLLLYLEAETVTSLAADLRSRAAIRWWMTDLSSRGVADLVRKGFKDDLANAPMKFAPANGVAFFEPLGWTPVAIHSLFHAAIALRRVPLWMRILGRLRPMPDPRAPKGLWSAVVHFAK